jgi:hypothetical protein
MFPAAVRTLASFFADRPTFSFDTSVRLFGAFKVKGCIK